MISRGASSPRLGTGLLVATVVGSGIVAERLTQDGAVALLANTLPTGAILVVLLSVLGPLSGTHLNPAVSLVMTLRRALPVGDAVLYVLAQLVGAVIGTVLAHAMFGLPLLEASQHVRQADQQVLAGRTQAAEVSRRTSGCSPRRERHQGIRRKSALGRCLPDQRTVPSTR